MNKLLLDCVRFGFTPIKLSFVALTSLHYKASSCTKPPSPIPRIPPKVAPKRATIPLPRHGLTAEYFSWSKPKETTKADLPTISKWQIGLFLWQKVARRDAQRAQQGRKPCTGRSRGAALGAPLVTFPATGKSPGVEGRSAPSWGCGGLQPPLRGAGAKSGDLLPRGRSPSQEPLGEKGAQAPFSKTAAAPAVPAGRPPPPEQSG